MVQNLLDGQASFWDELEHAIDQRASLWGDVIRD
jgi:hypothetical protein